MKTLCCIDSYCYSLTGMMSIVYLALCSLILKLQVLKMAKRKTREQKAIADQRHILYHLESSSAQVSLPSVKKSTLELNIPTNKSHTAVSYAYVKKDLRKTALITSAILTTQIVLFFILNRV